MKGCLPFLAIVYADFLDLPQGSAHVHELNYSVPRICHLSSSDFDFVMEIDRNNRARPHCYGIRPFQDISATPYCTIEPVVQANSRIFLHADVQRLADKHKLSVKNDIGILVKILTEISDNRITSCAVDFNSVYMSKIAESEHLQASAANAQATHVSDASHVLPFQMQMLILAILLVMIFLVRLCLVLAIFVIVAMINLLTIHLCHQTVHVFILKVELSELFPLHLLFALSSMKNLMTLFIHINLLVLMLYVIVESINCDGESLQEKNDIMQNIVAATIEEAGSKSMVQVANSLLDGLQIDTTTPLEVRQPLFDSNCGDNESGSKSMVQVANSLLDGLQIDTITPLEVRQPLFDSNCGDIESGIAIAMGYASPSASIVDTLPHDRSLGPSTIDYKIARKEKQQICMMMRLHHSWLKWMILFKIFMISLSARMVLGIQESIKTLLL
ncbi:uncharacterized protein LOC112877155 isoform X3 [Panicum hallii]|uniref:uncharacterized protein LOC112877155 isoform X3 n=1 Tax=Panicum hallii TaxID=206008 RepID=UPI000DF4E2CE|nr:uncharacterized protein LOC112877155 isoform X3 [Panicum hallii]